MEFETDRSRIIQEYAKDPSCKTSKTFGIPWNSEKLVDFPVYNIPTEHLSFNFDNARIRSEKTSKEMKLGPLDRDKKEHQKVVREILLNSVWFDKKDTEALKVSLRIQQQQPAIITFDGIVIDGNRRLACLNELHEKEGKPQYLRIDACILPKASKKELIMLENRLQLSKSYRVEYGPINNALRLREMKELEFEIPQILHSVNYRWTEKEIDEMIENINLVDAYLDAIGRSKDYESISDKGMESFRALLQGLSASFGRLPESKKKTEYYRRKMIGFQLISHPDTTYEEIRTLRDIYKNPTVCQEFLMNCDFYNNPNDSNPFMLNKTSKVLTNLQETEPFLDAEKSNPVKLASSALAKLNHIAPERIPRGNPEFARILSDINKRVATLTKRLAG